MKDKERDLGGHHPTIPVLAVGGVFFSGVVAGYTKTRTILPAIHRLLRVPGHQGTYRYSYSCHKAACRNRIGFASCRKRKPRPPKEESGPEEASGELFRDHPLPIRATIVFSGPRFVFIAEPPIGRAFVVFGGENIISA